MKKIILSIFLTTLILTPYLVLGAVDPGKLREKGIEMIDKRVVALERYDAFLAKTKHISEPTLNQVRGDISTEISALGTLKTQIETEEDQDTLRELVKDIVQEHYTYTVFLPKSSGLITVDRMRAYHDKLVELKDKIVTKTDQLEQQGKDVSQIRTLIATAEGVLGSGNASVDTAESKFVAISLTDPKNAANLKREGRTAILSAKTDFWEARKNLRDAVQEIKKLLQPSI